MSSTDSSADDHEYFQAIEETFVRLRGAPLLLSPADWQLAKQWHRQGIPLDLVLGTLEQVFVARQSRDAKGKVQGLRYCASAVERAHQERSELLATGQRQEATPIDIQKRLSRLAEALRATGAVPARFPERVEAFRGTPEIVEAELASLDSELIEEVTKSLDESSTKAIRESTQGSLARIESRLSQAEANRVRERLFGEAVRRHLRLPILSLFAVESTEDQA